MLGQLFTRNSRRHFRRVALISLLGVLSLNVRAQNRGMLTGSVLYPDGTPAAGAKVTATTDCETYHAGYRLVQYATAGLDGAFLMAAFGEGCQRYRFSANKSDDFWLETGDDIFLGQSNGTIPTLDLSSTPVPGPVAIMLGARGGKVDLQVWDVATARFIHATVMINHKPVVGKKFGSEEVATGKDGSPDTLFLPAGEYVASVDQYQCRDKEFWSATPPTFPFAVNAGERQNLKIPIDVRLIRNLSTYANPRGKRCLP